MSEILRMVAWVLTLSLAVGLIMGPIWHVVLVLAGCEAYDPYDPIVVPVAIIAGLGFFWIFSRLHEGARDG